MSSRSRTEAMCRTLAAVVLLSTVLAGCSDFYYDRRETIALGADDHIATDQVVQMVDPWPRRSGERNIAFNGEKMQSAVERYRTNRATPPISDTTAAQVYQQTTAAPLPATSGPATASAPAAPVR
jgi:hypothetical protein